MDETRLWHGARASVSGGLLCFVFCFRLCVAFRSCLSFAFRWIFRTDRGLHQCELTGHA